MVRSPESRNSSTLVDDIIADADTAFAALLRQARELTRLESILSGHCGPDLISHFQVAALSGDRLVLQTPTAAWATRLRMQAGNFLSFLQVSGYPQLRQIDIRVAPIFREPTGGHLRKPLSPEAKIALTHMAALTGSQPPVDDDGVEA